MPGYMPDSEPHAFDEWSEARRYLVTCIGWEYDSIEEGSLEETDIDATIGRADKLASGQTFGETVGRYHYWLTCE